MACGGTTGSIQKRLTALSTTQAIEWFTGWLSCVGLDEAMPVLTARAATSNYFEAQIVIQVAQVRTDAPEMPVLLGTASSRPGGLVHGFWGILGLLWDAGRLAVGFTLGTIWRGVEEAWDLFVGLVEDLWGLLSDAADDAVDWISSKWRSLLDWLGGLFGGDESGGGCCGCQCNPCYEYCPDLYNKDCTCTARMDADEDALLACTARCTEGMMEEMTGPASTESVTGE